MTETHIFVLDQAVFERTGYFQVQAKRYVSYCSVFILMINSV